MTIRIEDLGHRPAGGRAVSVTAPSPRLISDVRPATSAQVDSDPGRTTHALLAAVQGFIAGYVVLPGTDEATAIALFVLHTWAINGAHATPYLVVVSPEPRTGKSRLLEVLSLLAHSPWHTVSTTEAALFRKIDQDTPTLLLDEIDAIFGSKTERTEPLRAILNAGNRRGASVTRIVGQGASMDTREFSVFSPKVLAGIDTGMLPETIRDRAIVIHMKRRHDREPLQRLRMRHAEQEATSLVDALGEWANEHTTALSATIPDLPDMLNDRAGDAWEPLLAIADLAGGEWPERARRTAVALSGDRVSDAPSRGTQLLAKIRSVMGSREVVSTSDLLTAINADEELPFGASRNGNGLDARSLAKLLKPYGIKPITVRIEERTLRGYKASDLRETWTRYLPPGNAQQPSHPQHEAEPNTEIARGSLDVADVSDVADLAKAEPPRDVSNTTSVDCAHPEQHAEHHRPHPSTGRTICHACHPQARCI